MNQTLFLNSFKSAAVWVAFLLGSLWLGQAYAWEGDLAGNEYQAQEARRIQRVQVGVVEDIREVRITREASNNSNYIGAALGAVAGGLIGNEVGKGRGRTVAAALGGTMGGLAGKVASDHIGREIKRSAEIIVSMNNGNVVSVVQEMDGATAQLRPGDRVRLIEGQAVRVVKLGSYM